MKNHFLLQFRIVSGNDLSFPASKEEAPVTPSRPVRPSESDLLEGGRMIDG